MAGDPKAKQSPTAAPTPRSSLPDGGSRDRGGRRDRGDRGDRTSAVVAAGIVALFVIGMLTIFGEPLLVLLSPGSASEPAPAIPSSLGRTDGGGNS